MSLTKMFEQTTKATNAVNFEQNSLPEVLSFQEPISCLCRFVTTNLSINIRRVIVIIRGKCVAMSIVPQLGIVKNDFWAMFCQQFDSISWVVVGLLR